MPSPPDRQEEGEKGVARGGSIPPFLVAMKLSRQRRISLGLLGLGIAALAVDRLVLAENGQGLTGPAMSAAASLLVVPSSPASLGSLSPAKSDRVPAPSERLAALALKEDFDLLSVRDAFKTLGYEGEASSSAPAPTAGSADEFERRHRITGMMTSRTGKTVIIVEGKALQVGDELEGFVLRSIDGEGALFARGSDEARLARPGRTENR